MRLSLGELQEIKPLTSMPPPIPDDAAEHVDLEEAMRSALASKPPPPAPTIDIEAPVVVARRSRGRITRTAQAAMALVIGAGLAWVGQRAMDNDAEQIVEEPTAIASPVTAAEPDPAIAAPQLPDEASAADPANTAPTAVIDPASVSSVTDPVEAPPRPAYLPADYDSQEARAEREARRLERNAALEAAEAAAAEAAAAEAARREMPAHPDRDAVRDSMEEIRSRITECANGRHGTAVLEVTVHHSGRVQGARVSGSFGGSAEGSCMALAARSARFPRFSEDRFSLTYPFTF